MALLVCAVVLIICIVSNKVSNKIGIPILVLFIALGMLFGSDGIFRIEFDNYAFAEQLCSVALLFIMFYGGFGTNWKQARPVAPQAILLSSVGVVLTAAITGLFCHWILGMPLLEGLLIGAIVGSTDAASVFSILRSKNVNLKHGLASMLEIESGSNDPTAYMLTIILLTVMGGQDVSVGALIAKQLGFGLLCGAGIAWLARMLMQKLQWEQNGLHAIFVVAIALFSYAVPTLLGGNGYLSAYIVGIVLGNSKISNKVSLVHFFDGITWMMQIAIFFSLGLLAFPSKLPEILLPAIVIALILTFVARPLAVFSILSFFKTPVRQQLLVAWAGLRGAASIVFAILAVISKVSTQYDLFHIVFCIALLSVSFQGTLLPIFAKKLKLVDHSDSVLKTFNDYQVEQMLQLVEMPIKEDHAWAHKQLKQIDLSDGAMVVMVKRKDDVLIPNGDTMIQPSDTLVLCCTAYEDHSKVRLIEERITKRHPWANKYLRDLVFKPNVRVVIIKRDDTTLVPNGDTKIERNDTLVLCNIYEEPAIEPQKAKPPKNQKQGKRQGKHVKGAN